MGTSRPGARRAGGRIEPTLPPRQHSR